MPKISVPDMGFTSNALEHTGNLPLLDPVLLLEIHRKPFRGGQHENSLMVSTVYKFQYQQKA